MRQKDFPSALILLLLVGIASQRLAVTQWTTSLELVLLLAIVGAVLGLVLGISQFRRGVITLLASIYSLVVVPFTQAGFLLRGEAWLERMSQLGGRLLGSLSIVAGGEPLEDPFLLLFIFSTSFWFIGLSSGYWLTRKGSFLGAVVPSGIIIIVMQLFHTRSTAGTILTSVFVFLLLLLLGRMNYSRKREAWRKWSVFPTGEARVDINLTILIGTALLVLTAWLLPVSSRQIPLLREWWQEMTRLWQRSESLSNIFAGLEVDEGTRINNFYGPFLALGDDAPTSDVALFHIQNNGISSQERYYWRIRSYDTYLNGIWGTGTSASRTFAPLNRPLQLPNEVGVSVEFKVIVVNTRFGALVTPSRPTWVDRPSRLTYLEIAEEVVEPLIFQPNEPVQPGEEYLLRSLVWEPTEEELRSAGTTYPEWVTRSYLQLPTDLAPSILQLATTITADADTPYDKAQAITKYLRENITYNTHMESIPDGRSLLTWFLFDYKQGFCNYYATAEVILLRAAGVPARMTVGFSEGEFEMPGWYTVRQRDAHAWPEVYFPGLGWVEFEPTASEPELVRFQGEIIGPSMVTPTPSAPDTAGPLPGEGTSFEPTNGIRRSWQENWQNNLIILLILVLALIQMGNLMARLARSGRLGEDYRKLSSGFQTPIWIHVSKWLKKNALPVPAWMVKRAWMASLTPLERAFSTVYQVLHEFVPDASRSLTPTEAAKELIAYLPEAREEITILVEEYQPAFYGRESADMAKVQVAAASLHTKARQAQPTVWVNKQMKRSKFVEGLNLGKE